MMLDVKGMVAQLKEKAGLRMNEPQGSITALADLEEELGVILKEMEHATLSPAEFKELGQGLLDLRKQIQALATGFVCGRDFHNLANKVKKAKNEFSAYSREGQKMPLDASEQSTIDKNF